MVAKVLSFGISKGGCGKSTTAGVVSYLLSQEGYKVLCVDLDSQGNLTSLLTGEMDICTVFEEKTVLEGIKDADVRPYIYTIAENLDIVPSNDYLSLLPRMLYNDYPGNKMFALKEALNSVIDDYDYIVCDLPPSLSEHTLNAVFASDYVVVMFDGSQFCYYAIEKFLEICEEAKNRGNDSLKVAGILFNLMDPRTADAKMMIDLVDEEYPGMRFNAVLKRRAAAKRLPIYGFFENPELKDALEQYNPFLAELKELMSCVQKTGVNG